VGLRPLVCFANPGTTQQFPDINNTPLLTKKQTPGPPQISTGSMIEDLFCELFASICLNRQRSLE
jgi:hypothetical protein